jgi:predicted dehydrogenase
MTTKTLTIGLIGCGAFAESQDLPNFIEHPKLNLKWCCDANIERAEKMARKFSVPKVTADFNDVVNDPELDLIKISTSHEVHLQIISAAARKGVHVFCEKPMALDETEAYRIIEAVRRHKIKLCVDFNRRLAPSMHALKKRWLEHLADPKAQPWRYIEMERAPLPEENKSHLLMNIQDESSSYRIFHFNPLKGGGQIMGETVHWLDLTCWFFAPQLPVEITAWGDCRLSHGVNLKFSGGDTATINFHCSGTFDYPKEMYQLSGGGALFQNMFFVENRYYGIPGLDREVFPMQRDCMNELVQGDGFDAYMKKYELRNQQIDGNGKDFYNTMPFMVDKGHYGMLSAFIEAILNDTASPCDEIAGFTSTYLAQLAIKSIEQRQSLPVMVNKITPVFI